MSTEYSATPTMLIKSYASGSKKKTITISLPSWSTFTKITSGMTLSSPTFDSTVGSSMNNIVTIPFSVGIT